MEQDRSQETQSAYDSQDVSSSQQESTVSEGHSAGDDANSTSSLHDTEAINSAIMEVSGELVQGLFSPHKHISGGSDSSDISDDDNGQGRSLGAIARYPESSTGLSDNDWNPYATESDTNQTPRSPRSNASDDNRVGYISKASINVVAPSDKQKDVVSTVSMTTGKMTVGSSGTDREGKASRNGGERLDILKYMIDSDDKPDKTVVDAGKHSKQELIYSRLNANGVEGERRDSADSGRSVNSNESRHSHTEAETIKSSGSQDNRRESGGTVNTDGTRSTRDSFESAQSELERTTEAAKSARQSVDSQNSVRSEGSQASEASRKSEKSSGRGSDRSERLDTLSSATDENIKQLIQFETAQRVTNTRGENDEKEDVSRTRLSAKVESYRPAARTSGHEDRSRNALGRTGYVSVAERQLLLSESPDHAESAGEAEMLQQPAQPAREPVYKVPDMFMDRSPSEISMRRVSNLFEETKKQVRQAVSIPRPDPSGSEERFPLKERLTWNPHDDSLMAHEMSNKKNTRRGEEQKENGTKNLRDSEVARSLTSEEVARVLGRYSELEENGIATSTPINNFSDQPAQLMSAFDKIGQTQTGGYDDRRGDTADVSDDEIARKVQAILARSEVLGVGRSRQRQTESQLDREEYASRRIDYRRLERDLEEIQGSLPEVPRSKANDSIPMLSEGRSGATSAASEVYRSLESTGTATLGRESAMSEFNTRESGASEYGRRLAWDHGADLEYDPTYGGQFLGTMTSTETDTLSQRVRRLGTDPDNLIVRPDSTTTNDTDNEAAEFETLGTKTLTGSDISRAEKLVKQVMNRHAEGDLKESVEDIIARYRNERKDLFERYQHNDQREQVEEKEHLNPDSNHVSPTNVKEPTQKPLLKPVNGTHDGSGLAERVYKILTSDQKGITKPELVEKGMAQEVCRILTQERPHHQVNGILSEAMAEEHEMLKKLVTRPKDDSSMDDSGVNESEVSFATDDRAVRKQLEYSAMSSPEKADLTDIRHVTAAPYTAVSNAKSLLSSQLKKMSERNFDKTMELRTPYRQVIDCYPVYGVERSREPEQQGAGREAWMPRPRDAIRASDKDKALSNERFFLTDRDRLRGSQDPSSPDNHRTRTHSDPFDLSPGPSRNGHVRSRSEEAASDLGQHTAFGHHTADPELSYTDRRTASSPWSFIGPRKKDDDWSTPNKHIPKDVIQEGSLSESETSSSRKGSRLRPYRPMGSRDVYYTESGDDTNESGATVESTHAGSDDAVPPYFPRQILGSRQSPQRSPEGQDQQPQGLDEHTARQGNRGEITSKLTRQDLGEGKQGRTSDPTSPQRESGLDTGYQSRTTDRDIKPVTEPVSQLERPGFRTREEFERDFAQRERELRAEMQLRLSERRQEQQLGASTRSDPGGMLEDGGWEYSETDDSQGFRLMEPEPAYPRERLRCSRSKSDTNLMDISPNDSQKYSSPMQPGTRFLELSTQPSPIFGHHDSLTIPARRGPGQVLNPPPELPRVPVEREKGYGEEKRPSRSPIHEPVRPLEPGEPPLRSADLEKPRPLEPGPRPLEPGPCPLETAPAPRQVDCMGPVDLGADPRSIPLELRRGPSGPLRSRSPVSQRSRSRSPSERRSKSPLQVRQQEMERQLEALNQQLNNQVKEIQQEDKQTDEHFEDQFPPSKKAQVLREVLEQEYDDKLPPNINDMWSRFQATRDQSATESSLNSTRLDALSGLLQNPTSHTANSFIKAKHEERQQQQHKVMLAENDMTSGKDGQKAREKKQQDLLNEKEKLERDLRDFEQKAAEERSLRRQELRQRHGLSEEESNGSYQEILMEKSRRKEKRRTGDKGREREEVREGERKERKKKTPEKIKADLKARDEKENERRNVEKGVSTDIKYRSSNKSIATRPQHNDSVDTLFSIPEDASFEQSPSKAESEMRSKQRRHRHVIDPLMSKLRDKITLQRVKIDKERRKELQRVEKLKKLEMLLKAKTKGKLSDKAIDVELQNVSSTTSVSLSEQSSNLFSDSTVISTGMESDASSGISTTMKDTTVDTLKLQVKKYPVEKFSSPKKAFVDLSTDSAASSDFSNIVVERLPEMMDVPRESRSSKGKKVRVDEFGNKIRKEKKEKRSKKRKDEYNTAELMGEVIRIGLEREQYQSPQRRQGSPDRGHRSTGRHSSPGPRLSPDRRKRLMQDACTMYPSPMTVSPPSCRRLREVLMKSEAIQTSPSVRSTSPSYSYDEVPVAPVPLMSRMSTSKMSRCRPSSTSPTPPKSRSAQTSCTSSHKLSKSPSNSARSPVTFRKGSRSPIGRSSRKSSSSPLRHNMPRKTVNNPMWKPESETTPPNNSMFTPEDENTQPLKDRQEQATSWFIPMKTDKPWRQPLKERQAFSVRQETWQPTSVSQSTWKDIIHDQVLIDKGDPNDVSRDTKFDLDPDGQPIRDEETPTDSDEEDNDVKSRHLGKMTLQEAFIVHKQIVISRLRERQKRLNLAADQRKMDAFLKQERDKLFHEERRKEANPEAHPYSDNLYRPTRRTISKEEMKEMALKKYKKLPEVVEQEKLKKRQEEYSLNRLKARLFNRKMQRKVLQKADKWGR